MPELPETETIARDLNHMVRGRSIVVAVIRRPDVLRAVSAPSFRRRVVGQRVDRVWRRAKAVVIDLDRGDRLVVVPRFTGALLVDADTQDRYTAVALTLDSGNMLRYRDVRRLGTVSLMDGPAFEQFERRLGPEPLDDSLDTNRISDSLRSSGQAIKKVLMDQRRMAGIGNIYANEALWRAGIDPSRPGHSLSAADVRKLLDTVVTVLRAAIEARGTTFRDYRDARGGRGSFSSQLAAYGRQGMPCPRCGTRLALTHAIDGRATVFCFRCQR